MSNDSSTILIGRACKTILNELKISKFTRRDLNFLQNFFKEIATTTEKMLKEVIKDE